MTARIDASDGAEGRWLEPEPRRRVVVTGVGAVSPLGLTADDTWRALLAGRSGIGPITSFDPQDLSVRIAGEVRGFAIGDWVDSKTARQMTTFSQYAVAAAGAALRDARVPSMSLSDLNPERCGLVLGTAAGGTAMILDVHETAKRRGLMKISPFSMVAVQYNMAAYHVAQTFHLLGPNLTVSTACATGAQAIGEAAHLIRLGKADLALAGGAEHCVFPLVLAGFAVQRAVSTWNEEPERASRPFDAGRHGFVIGEGAAVLVLESLAHARARGAPIYAELLGYGASSDGFHPIAPDPQGRGAARAMSEALADGGIAPEQVDYINAHGTSTPLGDKVETLAIKRALGDRAYKIAISSTKSMIGHLMGAAGAIEAMATVLTIRDQIIHPTINYETLDPECDLDYVPNVARRAEVNIALSNSIGLGGQNACLVFGRLRPAGMTE